MKDGIGMIINHPQWTGFHPNNYWKL